MKELIKEYYDLDVQIIIKISDKVYRLRCDNREYILKYIESGEVNTAYSRLDMLNMTSFVIPIKNIYGDYVSESINGFFEITPYYQDEVIVAKDLRLRHFVVKLATLHQKSQFQSKVSEGFFQESYEFIKEQLQIARKGLDNYLLKVEALDYKSPSQWLLLLNNQLFYKAIDDAKEHLEKFHDLTKELPQLRVSIIYQNFDYNHILIKQDKIIGTQNLTIGPPIYDLKHLFDYSFVGSLDITGFLQEYFSKFFLLEYEKEWLMALLLIPNFNFNILNSYKDIDAIVNITRSISHLKNANQIQKILNKDDD